MKPIVLEREVHIQSNKLEVVEKNFVENAIMHAHRVNVLMSKMTNVKIAVFLCLENQIQVEEHSNVTA